MTDPQYSGPFQAAVSRALDAELSARDEPANHFALVAEIGEKHISRIRAGHRLGSPAVLDAIAAALGCRWTVTLDPIED